ncbi:carboxypeptidase-like regulatory domain-containing protein [Adhaeretor mobilis]|uniref:Carboxypeptidase regulatory-like domain-containing protein n=1 Tax=Adhaeretor mobilis TaxID=1930276 RepID=A0A517MTH6_9BACT|nr:carboxypeptidase-like regulatory domain-containing protein [Adhaeretor mobilis]QDS98189.1 hypothetical protein HG15A2_14620 [Adhaeretor mobilis]
MLSTRVQVFLGLVACVCGGCGPQGPPMGSISGTVTYEEQPLKAGVVTFVNEKIGTGSSAELDSSGNYHIPSLQVGEYTVAVHNWPPPPGGKFVKLNIPEKFQDLETSGLTKSVEEGENKADFSL